MDKYESQYQADKKNDEKALERIENALKKLFIILLRIAKTWGVENFTDRASADEREFFKNRVSEFYTTNDFAKISAESIPVYVKMTKDELANSEAEFEIIQSYEEIEEIMEDRNAEQIDDTEAFYVANEGGKPLDKNSKLKLMNLSGKGMTWRERLWADRRVLAVGFRLALLAYKKRRYDNEFRALKKLKEELNDLKKQELGRRSLAFLTEVAKVETEVAKREMMQAGIEKYDLVTYGDERVCEVCADIEASGPYLVRDMEPFVNASPMHPRCRCKEVPHRS